MYHIIIDESRLVLQNHKIIDAKIERQKCLKLLELIFLDEEIPKSSKFKYSKQIFGSIMNINPITKEPFYSPISISLLEVISNAIEKFNGIISLYPDELPTIAVVVTLTDNLNHEISEFDSFFVSSRSVNISYAEKGKWFFKKFNSSIDSVSIAAEMTNTNHFVTAFAKNEMELVYRDALNDAIAEYYKRNKKP